MSSNGQIMIIGVASVGADAGHPNAAAPGAVPARLQQVINALDAGRAAGGVGAQSSAFLGVRSADPAHLDARRAALAAALQEWSGTAAGTLRTTALAVLAASRAAKLRQEASRAAHHPEEETVFEAFFRGVEGRPAPHLLARRGVRQ